MTPLGEAAAALLRRHLARLWPDCRGETVLGIGFAAPYRTLWTESARAVLSALPPREHRGVATAGSCLTDGKRLPFPDLSVDRVLLVHGLETAGNGRRLLREIWRVLRDDGRLLIVAPNRTGAWAHADWTPFGQGEPYSPGQIARLLADGFFRVERFDRALHAPPLPWRGAVRAMPALDAAARWLVPGFAGVTLTEAVKDAFAAVPVLRPVVKAGRMEVPARMLVASGGRALPGPAGVVRPRSPGAWSRVVRTLRELPVEPRGS